MEKKKGIINCAVQVVTRIFNLSILNLVKTWNKAKTEETNCLQNKFHLEWQYIDWALFCSFAYRIYTRTVRLLYLLTLLFKSTNYKTFSALFYIMIYYKYLRLSHNISKEDDNSVTTEFTLFLWDNSSISLIDLFKLLMLSVIKKSQTML